MTWHAPPTLFNIAHHQCCVNKNSSQSVIRADLPAGNQLGQQVGSIRSGCYRLILGVHGQLV
jgi:hypothetical protein